jgi:hypothetical protein
MGIGFRSGEGNGWTFDVLVRAIKRGGNTMHRLLPIRERQRVAELLACLPEQVEQPPEATGHYSFWHLPSRASCAWCVAECLAIALVDRLAREAKAKGRGEI